MRTHPLGLMCLRMSVEETFEVAADFSVVTHVDPRCVLACAVGTALVRGLVRGEVGTEEDVDGMLDAGVAWFRARQARTQRRHPQRRDPALDVDELERHARARDLGALRLDEADSIGYVYKTFGSGLVVLRQAMRIVGREGTGTMSAQLEVFEALMTPLVMEAGDADTNACFAGALLGAYVGYKALPPHWRDGLRHGAWLLGKAEGLCQTVGVTRGRYRGSRDGDTALDGGRGFLTEAQMEAKWREHKAWVASEDVKHQQRAVNRGKS